MNQAQSRPNQTKLSTLAFQYPVWSVCIGSILLAAFYWGIWASDRYVSQANIVLESPQMAAPTLDFSSLLSGNSGNSGDMLLLRDYLLSVDIMRKINVQVGFRAHYASTAIDFFSRLQDEAAPIEDLHEYYLERVSVELDEYANVLRLNIEAFSPQIAQQITRLLLSEGEAHMNTLGQRLAAEQVRFLEVQVRQQGETFDAARQALLQYQNDNGLISPQGTVESLSAVVGNLESQLANLNAKRKALRSYHSALSPAILKLDSEITALKQQIELEQARMAKQSGGALNALSSEYQTLELRVHFAQESYSGALAALENTRIEAARKLKQVSVLQSPTLPEYPVEPRRLYNIVVFAIVALFISLIVQMLAVIVKDHRD